MVEKSNKVNLASWPEENRKLADYVISMQQLKFDYRKLLNDLALGKESILSEVLEQVVIRTKKEDSPSMTIEEVEKTLNGEELKPEYAWYVGRMAERHFNYEHQKQANKEG